MKERGDMAIISASRIQAQAEAGNAFASREVAKKAAALFKRLESPRYEDIAPDWTDDLDGIDAERLVLVFVNEPAIELTTPALFSRALLSMLSAPRMTAALKATKKAADAEGRRAVADHFDATYRLDAGRVALLEEVDGKTLAKMNKRAGRAA
jgi:hypothetical protein